MIQNIIIGIIVIGAIILVIRHFKKGKCNCCENSASCNEKISKKKPSCCK